MNTKQTNKALKNYNACFSFKGRDFNEILSGAVVGGPKVKAWAKKMTSKAQRRLSRNLISE